MTAKFIISGHVQGVGFRYFVYRNAMELSLSGYAKNLYDGSVEVVAQGERVAILRLHDKLKTGPTRSNVTSCYIEWLDNAIEYSGFDIH